MSVRIIRCAVADPDPARAARLAELLETEPRLRIAQTIHSLDRLAALCGATDLEILIIDWDLVGALPRAEQISLLRAAGVERTILMLSDDVLAADPAAGELGTTYVERSRDLDRLDRSLDALLSHVLALDALRRVDAESRQTRKMEALGRLAAGVAHDFNAQLTAILGFGASLRESLAAGTPRAADVEEILRAARRGTTLTRQLLAFSRKQDRQPRPVRLDLELAAMAGLLEQLVARAVTLRVDAAPDLPCVLADPAQIEQVVTNLVINARDAMSGGGTVTICICAVSELPPELDPGGSVGRGPWVRLTVSDTGTGMDEEAVSHLFEPFYSTKSASAGTGLGLSTVYGIVQQNAGHIQVSTARGQGTTIAIYLPVAEEVAAPPKLLAEAAAGATVLLVEPERAVRLTASATLRRNGYRVLEAGTAPEALAQLDAAPGTVHLAIVDSSLDAGGEYDLTRALGQRISGARVLFTAVAASPAGTGSEAPLLKPFTPDELLERARETLGGPAPFQSKQGEPPARG